MKKIILSAFVLIGGFSAANAQVTSAVNQTVTVTLQNSINIAISAATGTNFTFANTNDYSNGLTNTTASSFLVKSNRPWAVTFKADAANFTGPAGNTMPSNVLGVRLTTGTNFGALATTAAPLTTGPKGSTAFSIDYNANPGISYDAGAYTMAVVYTATQQ